ncbi:hypothetical protein ACVW0K_007335 [Streptomyces filamentosus]
MQPRPRLRRTRRVCRGFHSVETVTDAVTAWMSLVEELASQP